VGRFSGINSLDVIKRQKEKEKAKRKRKERKEKAKRKRKERKGNGEKRKHQPEEQRLACASQCILNRILVEEPICNGKTRESCCLLLSL
jgi:hypothetical protein